MDLNVLKKKISSYRTPSGQIRSLPDELLGEILHAWEQWTGPSSGFYRELEVDYRKMSSLMGKAKKLKREGAFDGVDFAEVKIIDHDVQSSSISTGHPGIEILWKNTHVIRFSQLGDLILFLQKIDSRKHSMPRQVDEAA